MEINNEKGNFVNTDSITHEEITNSEKILQFNQKSKYNNNNFIYIIFPFKLFILIIIFKFLKKHKKFDNNNNNIIDLKKNEIKREIQSSLVLRVQAINNSISYITTCAAGHLINKENFTKIENPLISVIIPCYFCAKYIKGAVRSIQNQNLKDINIIIVNDDLDNNTIKTLYDLKEEDPRIEVICNKKRMGILYTRSIGILNAKSDYVITLDQDDFFSEEDLFDYLYKVAENENLDIVGFKVFEGYDYTNKNYFRDNYNNKRKTNLTIFQPELSCHTLVSNKTFKPNDIYIWGKFYKTLIYQSAINLLGKERYSVFMEWEEDVIMTFLIVNVANSYKFIDKYGYFHLFQSNTPSTILKGIKKNYYRLIKVEIFFDFSKKECKVAPVYELINMKKSFPHKLDAKTKKYLKRLIKKIFGSEINRKFKDKIKELYKYYFPGIYY